MTVLSVHTSLRRLQEIIDQIRVAQSAEELEATRIDFEIALTNHEKLKRARKP